MKRNSFTKRHTSGSPSAWQERRAAYRKNSGPVSNPGDGRPVARVRRYLKREAAREVVRTYLAAWDEALAMDAEFLPTVLDSEAA